MTEQISNNGRAIIFRACAATLLVGGLCMPAAAQGGPPMKEQGRAPYGTPLAQNNAGQEPAAAKSMRTETVRHGSWVLTCKEKDGAPPERSCSATVRVLQQPKQVVLVVWEIARAPDGTLRSVMQTGTGVSVKPGVELKLGNTTVATFNYVICSPKNCDAAGVIDDALRRKLQSAREITLLVHAKDGREVRYRFPIEGIDKVFVAMGS